MPQYLLVRLARRRLRESTSRPAMRSGRLRRSSAVNDELQRAGAWVFAAGLRPASSATVVRAERRRRLDDRRSVRRDQGADGWLLGHPGRRPRRRARLGQQGRGRVRGPGRGAAPDGE